MEYCGADWTLQACSFSSEKSRVLRFRPHPAEVDARSRQARILANRVRWRLWLLLVSLGLVAFTMRELNQPEAAHRFGQIFGTPDAATPQAVEEEIVVGGFEGLERSDVASNASAAVASTPQSEQTGDRIDPLAYVQDNTYFRPAETDAWFGLFNRLQQMDEQQLKDASLGELTYTQLLEQPDVYRGQVVTVRGTLRAEEIERPAANSLGIATYHRLVIEPRGGARWPIVAYCLELPSELPRGDDLRETIAVSGFFFKNWSYAWQDGLGIAPVVLARGVDWQPTVAPPARRRASRQGLTLAVLVACVCAVMVVSLVVRSTRRPPQFSRSGPEVKLPDETMVETIDQQLQRLADTENSG